MARTKRQYSDEDKALALETLELYRGNVKGAARYCNIPERTLRSWRDQKNMHVEAVGKIRAVKKGALAERLKDLAELLIDNVHTKLEEASLQQIMTSVGIAVDKAQLLTGQPTLITDDLSNIPESELDARITALERGEISEATTPEANPDVSGLRLAS